MSPPAAIEVRYAAASNRNKGKPWYQDLGTFRDAMLDLVALTSIAMVKPIKEKHDHDFKHNQELTQMWRNACAAHYRRLEV